MKKGFFIFLIFIFDLTISMRVGESPWNNNAYMSDTEERLFVSDT